MFFSFSKAIIKHSYVAVQYSAVYNACVGQKKREREREKRCQTVQRRKGKKKQRKAEVGEQMAKWQDNKLLILCIRLVKEMETVKSQRGAKNTAQYGTAHQIPF